MTIIFDSVPKINIPPVIEEHRIARNTVHQFVSRGICFSVVALPPAKRRIISFPDGKPDDIADLSDLVEGEDYHEYHLPMPWVVGIASSYQHQLEQNRRSIKSGWARFHSSHGGQTSVMFAKERPNLDTMLYLPPMDNIYTSFNPVGLSDTRRKELLFNSSGIPSHLCAGIYLNEDKVLPEKDNCSIHRASVFANEVISRFFGAPFNGDGEAINHYEAEYGGVLEYANWEKAKDATNLPFAKMCTLEEFLSASTEFYCNHTRYNDSEYKNWNSQSDVSIHRTLISTNQKSINLTKVFCAAQQLDSK